MSEKVDAYQIVTDRIIEQLESGTVPWAKPWRSVGGHGPTSMQTGRPYQGINVLMLWLQSHSKGYTSPYWVTFKQAKERGGSVRKGEKATPIVFWRFIEKQEHGETKRIPFLRYYSVFNTEQCDGIEIPEVEPLPERDRIAAAEALQASMPHRPEVKHGGDRAYYSPTLDYVQVPLMGQFVSSEAYYQTLFHELVHSTGHESRLGRKLDGWQPFGSESYSREELVAEMGAAFLCAEAGIEPDVPQSAAYIESWLKALKGDKKLIVTAASQAAKAAAYIVGEEEEGAV